MKTVMVVEDDPHLQAMLRGVLGIAGYRVVAATSAEEGLQMLEEEEPDVLLLDIRLPGRDGWSLLERLEGTGRLDRLPVLIVSAHDSASDQARAAAFGCRGFVRKPFSIHDLMARLQELLGPAASPGT